MNAEETDFPAAWLAPDAPPMEVDFGCHRGAFLTGMAELHPARNFLGIERQSSRVAICRKKILSRGLANAWAVRGDGWPSLATLLPAGSVAVLHVSFPDPWPKRRHASRRVVSGEFVAAVWRVLRPDGVLRLMTDDASYFDAMLAAVGEAWPRVEWDDGVPRVATTFEKTFLGLGREPCRAAFRRSAVSPPIPLPWPPPDANAAPLPTASQGSPTAGTP